MLPLKPKGADQEVMVSPFFAPLMFEILNLWEGFKVIDGKGIWLDGLTKNTYI